MIVATYFSWSALVVAAVIALFTYILERRFWIIALAFFLGSGLFLIHTATLEASIIAKLVDTAPNVKLIAVVTSDPKVSFERVRGSNINPSRTSFLIRSKLVESQIGSYRARLPVRVLISGTPELTLGEVIEIEGRLIESKERRVAAMLIAEEVFERLSKTSALNETLAEIRQRFRSQAAEFKSDSGALLPGMILGDTSLQSEEFTKQMRRSGLAHLTAVSGANFAIVSSLVFFLLRYLIANLILRIILTGAILSLFLLLVRPSPSVLRAGVMALVVLLAIATGNRSNAAAALSAAIIVLLLLDPFQGQDPGFILSVLATSGLIFLSPSVKAYLTRFLPHWLAEVVAVSIAATLLCTPYLIAFTGQGPLLAIPSNVVSYLLVAPVTILGFLSVLALPIPPLSEGLLAIAEFLARWIAYVASLSDRVPTPAIAYQLLLTFVALITLALFFRALRKIAILALLALLIIAALPRITFPGSSWQVVQCDVGQGDALVIKVDQSSALLFDAGPDPWLIDTCLKSLGVKNLPLIVLSHNHADHYYGISGALKNREIGQIWSNGNINRQELSAYSVNIVSAGDQGVIGEIRLQVLWPLSTELSYSSLSGDGSAENNRSLVILAKIGKLELLITGDIEPEVQEEIAKRYDLSQVLILKVPHHGSRFQSDLFLSQVSPQISLVSVGRGNSYGHPDPSLLAKLEALGSKVYRSDEDGPIALGWRFDDGAMGYIFTARKMRKEWWQIQWL